MRARSPVRALLWKEARETWFVFVAALAAVGALGLARKHHAPQDDAVIFAFVVSPAIAAIFGGLSIATESGGPARHFLLARAVEPSRVRAVKTLVHALAAALAAGSALAVAAVFQLSEDGWSAGLGSTSARAWTLALVLTVMAFLAGLTASLVLADGLNAVLGGLLAALLLALAFVLVPWSIGGSMGAALEAIGPLAIGAIAAPGSLALLAAASMRRRQGEPARGGARRLAVATLAVASVLAWGRVILGEPSRVREVLTGAARVDGAAPIVAGRDGAVAFVASPSSGRARAVIALTDARRVVSLSVLAPGTRPVGWTEAEGAFVIAWPDGAMRLVTPSGDVSALARALPPDLSPDPGAHVAEASRLMRRDAAGDVLLFPWSEVQ